MLYCFFTLLHVSWIKKRSESAPNSTTKEEKNLELGEIFKIFEKILLLFWHLRDLKRNNQSALETFFWKFFFGWGLPMDLVEFQNLEKIYCTFGISVFWNVMINQSWIHFFENFAKIFWLGAPSVTFLDLVEFSKFFLHFLSIRECLGRCRRYFKAERALREERALYWNRIETTCMHESVYF